MGTHRLLPATESSPRHRRLPYRRSGRTSRTLRWLPPRGDRLQLMPQSQLSKVPIHRTRPLAGRASQGTAPRALLPRRPHAAGITRHGGITERATGIRAVVPCGFSESARDRSRSKAPRRKNRLPRRAAHLESTIAAPSAPSLRRSSRRTRARRISLDPLSPKVLSAGEGSKPTLPREISGSVAGCFCPWETPVSRSVEAPSRTRPVSRLPAPVAGH